ncbi:hypothetical protein NDU88_004749 [Pleurodeles waltl]|uniref:Uncharacterized protein n=1 Tax=Pleurodeles waltl TaxID=8319 RepID=A0AAV7TAL8_PLEWA|nr:hypothetical protein NDU88_004749 [Pleurodeles waltl]
MERQLDAEKEGCTEEFMVKDDDEYALIWNTKMIWKMNLELFLGQMLITIYVVGSVGEGSLPTRQVLGPNIMEQEVSEETLEVLNFTHNKEGDVLGLQDREAEVWDMCKVKIRERG